MIAYIAAMTSGVRLRPAEQVLISRARDFLAAPKTGEQELIVTQGRVNVE